MVALNCSNKLQKGQNELKKKNRTILMFTLQLHLGGLKKTQ